METRVPGRQLNCALSYNRCRQVLFFGAGDRFGFSWMVNEMDAAGTSEGFAEWTSGIGYTKDPSLFGDLVLRDCD